MSKDIRTLVCEVVTASNRPIDPENISKNIGVAWATALKYAMELVIEGKITGIRTSKGWIFWRSIIE